MRFMQILLHPLFAPLKKEKKNSLTEAVLSKKSHSLLLISVLPSSSSQQGREGEEPVPAGAAILFPRHEGGEQPRRKDEVCRMVLN